MEKQIAFTGILSNKPEENPGIISNSKLNSTCQCQKKDKYQ